MLLAQVLSFWDHMPQPFDLADFINPVDTQPSPTVHRASTRRVARYRTELPVSVRVLVGNEYICVPGRCFEIGEMGLGAVIARVLPAGEMVSLELSLPQLHQAEPLRAVVRHRMGFLHGFEFMGIVPEQRERIRAYCRSLTAV
jgi:hypothetical protein